MRGCQVRSEVCRVADDERGVAAAHQLLRGPRGVVAVVQRSAARGIQRTGAARAPAAATARRSGPPKTRHAALAGRKQNSLPDGSVNEVQGRSPQSWSSGAAPSASTRSNTAAAVVARLEPQVEVQLVLGVLGLRRREELEDEATPEGCRSDTGAAPAYSCHPVRPAQNARVARGVGCRGR